MNAIPLARRLLAGICGVVAGVTFTAMLSDHERVLAAIPMGFLLVAAVAVHLPKLGPQLVARAAWWSSLALGVLICVTSRSREGWSGLVMTFTTGLALLLVGQKGLDEAGQRSGYAPAAFRTSLLLLMIFTLADAQTVGLFALAGLTMDHQETREGLCLLVGALGFVGAFIGLYRVALWGAVLSIVTSVGVAASTLFSGRLLEGSFRGFVLLLCALQIAVALPMVVSVLSGRKLPTPSPRLRGWAASSIIVLLVALSVLGVSGVVYVR